MTKTLIINDIALFYSAKDHRSSAYVAMNYLTKQLDRIVDNGIKYLKYHFSNPNESQPIYGFIFLFVAPLQRYSILLRIFPPVSLKEQKRRKIPLFWQVKLLFSLKIHKNKYEARLFLPYLKLIN